MTITPATHSTRSRHPFVESLQTAGVDLVSENIAAHAADRVQLSPVIAILAPGQGAQKPGMLTEWLVADGARQRLEQFSRRSGLDLITLGTTATAEQIKDTAITQPLIVATSLLAYEQLNNTVELPDDVVVAGHSVGELAAAAIAGVLAPDDAVALAAVRGAEMAKACALEHTGMSAVLGGDESDVLARLAELELTPANRNGAGQIVAAGGVDGLDRLKAAPPAGARVIPLAVAGAFHTEYMNQAVGALSLYAKDIRIADPSRPLLSNLDGQRVESGSEMRDRLVGQVTKSVRWDRCMATIGELGAHAVIELPPAGTLVGLVRRALPATKTIAVKTPANIDTVAELIAGQPASGDAR